MGLKPRHDPGDELPDEQFWALIEAHVRVLGNGRIDGGALPQALALLQPERILSFDRVLRRMHARSRTWALWGAASVIHQGCPDDTFDYFRSWLIGRGRGVFEAALEDPDSLASVATEEALDDGVYCAGQTAYREVTGKEIPWDGRGYEPLDQDFDLGDDEELRRRYPRLHQRFAGARG